MRMKHVIAVVCAALVGGGAVAGIAYKSKGFTDWTKENWLNSKHSEPTNETENYGGIDVSDTTEKVGSKMSLVAKPLAVSNTGYTSSDIDNYGVETYAMSASYTLTATIEPDTVTDSSLIWSIAWKNPSSSWASGKSVTDYITLTDNDSTATVTLKSAFGEQAIITVAAASNENATATCTVDYVQRLSLQHGNAYMDIKRIYQNQSMDFGFSFGESMNFKAISVYNSIGTQRGKLTFDKLEISLDSTLQDYIRNNSGVSTSSYYFRTLTRDFSSGLVTAVTVSSPNEFWQVNGASEWNTKILNAFVNGCKNGGTIRIGTTFTYTYNGTVVQTGQAFGDFTVNTNGLGIAATDVTLDNTSIVF